MIDLKTTRYSTVVAAFVERYPDAEARLDKRRVAGPVASWCTNAALREAVDFSLTLGDDELLGFHDGPRNMWASSEALPLVGELASRRVLRYRVSRLSPPLLAGLSARLFGRRPRSLSVLGLVFAVALATACSLGGSDLKPVDTPNTQLALRFAQAMAAGDAAQAHGLLSPGLQAEVTREKLARDYAEMIAYGRGAPTILQVMNTMTSWPDKRPSDNEWVYVAIANDTYSEAVTVIVAREASRLVIRSVEWGRP
jgi:hypothetical protein